MVAKDSKSTGSAKVQVGVVDLFNIPGLLIEVNNAAALTPDLIEKQVYQAPNLAELGFRLSV